jgi:hypothetical protein
LKYAKKDIRPDYSGKGFGISSGMGYSYSGIDDADRNFIYAAIGSLSASVSDAYGPIAFDIENHYITESKAVKELDLLKERYRAIREKYKGTEHSQYPIQVCLENHEQVYEILEEIYNSDEFKEFKMPGKIDTEHCSRVDITSQR